MFEFFVYILFFLSFFVWTGLIPIQLYVGLCIVPVLVGFCWNIIRDCSRYGVKRVFHFQVKKEDQKNRLDILKKTFEDYPDTKVWLVDKYPTTLFILNANAFFVYYVFAPSGILKEEDGKWYRKKGIQWEETLNGFDYLDSLKEEIDDFFDVPISYALIVDSFTRLQNWHKRYSVLNDASVIYSVLHTNLDTRLTEEEREKIEKTMAEKIC